MSHFTSHHIFGQQVLKDGPSAPVRTIKQNLNAFCWGLQGADLLYLHRNVYENSVLPTYGRMIHGEKTNTLFTFLAHDLLNHRNCKDFEPLLAYFYGFCCHYALDSNVHPYVFSLQKQAEDSFSGPGGPHSAHWTIEDGIDRELSAIMEAAVTPAVFVPDYYEVDANVQRAIGGLYARILWNVYGIRVQAKIVDECFNGHCWKADCLYQADGNLKPYTVMCGDALQFYPDLCAAIEKAPVTPEDYLNRNHRQWIHYGDSSTHSESVPELMEYARELALDLWSLGAKAVTQGNRHLITNFDFSKTFVEGKFVR